MKGREWKGEGKWRGVEGGDGQEGRGSRGRGEGRGGGIGQERRRHGLLCPKLSQNMIDSTSLLDLKLMQNKFNNHIASPIINFIDNVVYKQHSIISYHIIIRHNSKKFGYLSSF